ncbi:MAG TPA: DoxX family protein [Solimonas sp.]
MPIHLVPDLRKLQHLLDRTTAVDFLAPLAMRLYLAPVFWMAGTRKFAAFPDTVAWFGDPDWGLGLPAPALMAFLAAAAESVGAVLLVLGLGVRWICVPLMVTMLVAMVAVHADAGWLAIAEGQGLFATERTMAAVERLAQAKALLQAHGDYEELTRFGSLVMLNNGIEFSATYFVMLLSLFFVGAGRYVSIDHWLRRRWMAGDALPAASESPSNA